MAIDLSSVLSGIDKWSIVMMGELIDWILLGRDFSVKIGPTLWKEGSLYLKILFTCWMTYRFFLKQLFKERQLDRQERIDNRKYDFYREFFDQIASRVEAIYLLLGTVKSYAIFLEFKQGKSLEVFRGYYKAFSKAYGDLQERLQLLDLAIEKYDFLFDRSSVERAQFLEVKSKLSENCFEVSTCVLKILGLPKQEDLNPSGTLLNSSLKALNKSISEINLSVKGVMDKCQSIFKPMFVKLTENAAQKTFSLPVYQSLLEKTRKFLGRLQIFWWDRCKPRLFCRSKIGED